MVEDEEGFGDDIDAPGLTEAVSRCCCMILGDVDKVSSSTAKVLGDRLELLNLPGLSNNGETADEAEECALVGRAILSVGMVTPIEGTGDG